MDAWLADGLTVFSSEICTWSLENSLYSSTAEKAISQTSVDAPFVSEKKSTSKYKRTFSL
jgi:hypothetical protein